MPSLRSRTLSIACSPGSPSAPWSSEAMPLPSSFRRAAFARWASSGARRCSTTRSSPSPAIACCRSTSPSSRSSRSSRSPACRPPPRRRTRASRSRSCLRQPLAEITARPAPDNLRLGCTPAINLFPHTADPISVTELSVEYPVTADARAPHSYEIHSIKSVTSATPGLARGPDLSAVLRLAPWHAARDGRRVLALHSTPVAAQGRRRHRRVPLDGEPRPPAGCARRRGADRPDAVLQSRPAGPSPVRWRERLPDREARRDRGHPLPAQADRHDPAAARAGCTLAPGLAPRAQSLLARRRRGARARRRDAPERGPRGAARDPEALRVHRFPGDAPTHRRSAPACAPGA